MKNLLRAAALAICAIFMVANVSAQVITAERASEIANQFFANGKQKSAAFRSTSATLTQSVDSHAITGESNEAPTFHILTGADGKGFVIVSGEETENPIIGYSLDGTIDTNNLPDGFVGYMSDIDAQVRALRKYNAANPQKAAARSAMQKAADYEYNATSMGNIVKNLNTAPWGQHGPFNNLCKTADGQTALTGCGPTAFAILCYYYKWPASGVGTVTHQGTSENMELGHTYDYASMRNDDYRSGYTEAEANAVAVLMRDLGWANQVGYGPSSTSFSETGQHMVDHFRFKSERPVDHGASLAVVRSTLGNDTQWKTYIKNCLDAGYPIPYASTTNTSNSARHIYILDGYTDNDYYHFNWGWSGQGNGWFTLDNMVPDDYSNYSNSHKAYFNLIPDATTYTVRATATPSNMGTVSINGGTAGSTVTADLLQGVTATLTAHPAQDYALASWTKGGVIVGTRNTIQVTVGTDANDYVANFDNEENVLVVKEYTVNPANGSLSGGTSKYSTWTSTDTQPALTLKATNASGAAVYAISALSSSYKAYATAYDSSDKAHTNITYTLSVPEGYVITNYLMTYNVGTAGQISLNGELLNATGDHTLSAAPNAQTASFTLSVPSAGQQYITVKSIAVTVQSEGGGSTPTPTTYTINATAGTGGSVTINGEAVSQKSVNENSTVTLVATPSNGYSFVNWTSGTSTIVSTNATYSFTATGNTSLLANFAQATYTVNVEATEGGSAYIGTKGTTEKTVSHNENVTITAEANDGYRFVEWRAWNSHFSSNAQQDVSVTTDVTYTAVFEAEAQEPAQNITGTIVGVNRVPTTRFDLSQGLKTGYYLLKQVNDNASAAGGQGIGWIKAASETVGASATSKNTGAPSETDNTYIWYVEVVDAANKTITISTANKVAAWQTPYQRQKDLVAYAEKATLKYHTETVNLSGNATPKEGSCFLSTQDGSAYVHFSGDYLGSWTDTNQGSMFMVEFYELSIDDLVQKNIVTFEGATYTKTDGTELTSGWGYQVVTQTTPAVTIKVAETKNNFGYTTGVISGVKTPYLYKNTNFILSISEQYKITGYKITVRGQDNSYSGDFTCSVDGNETSKATLSGTTTQTLSATGLDTNIINISVGGTSGNGIFITALEITYIENEFTPLPFKAEIEGWRNDNPNTHLGTITIGGTPMKLTPEHLTASELTMPVVEGTTLAFTRKYRGFEFQGFHIGATSLGTNPTLTADNVAAINENTPLVAKFTATNDVTLFYDDDTYSYRIPAIAKTGDGMLIAVSDYRHNLDDIGRDNHGTGTKRIDLVMRTSTDNGATWSETKTIAAGDNSKAGSYLRAFGDAAIAAVGGNIVVMAAAGDVVYTAGTTSSPNKMARIYSSDNGATWAIEEMTTKMYSQSTSLIPSGGSAFFGSGKLAVDPNFNGTGNARIYGALLVRIGTDGYNNFGVFSDDLGATWKILGGDNTNPVAKGDEPKVEILPNGQILLSARRGGGRVFRVFTYGDDKANGAGSWGDAAVNGCDNGGSNATNGEIICLEAKRPNGKPTKILLQSQPKGGSGQYDRYNVTIWYKEVSADETYTPSSIASGWTQGLEVSPADVKSAYSAMCLQADGKIAFFFEEAPCYGDDHTKGYSMVYVPLTIEEITNNNFLNPNADVEYVPVEFNIELTDTEGNIYRETLDYVPNDAAAVATYLTTTYPFITLGENGAIADNTYTNTVTLPFKVSNANTTVWHNIYFPANGTSAGEYYPIYLMAENENATAVAKITEKVHYGNSQYNTYNYADKLAWAVYNVNEGFTFKFKNKLTGKFMAVTGVSSDNTNNVVYTDEAGATAFTLEKYTGGNASYGNYAIKSVYNSTTGYVCNTSVGYTYATNFPGTGHAGAWAKFVESPDYWTIYNQLIADINNFCAGEGKYTANDAISSIDKDALATMPINSLNTQKENVQTVKDSYTEITLTVPAVNDVVPGSVKILGEEVSHKFVPKGEITIQAVPAAGYRFVNWTRPAAQTSAAARTAAARSGEIVSDANPYTVTVSEAVSLEANFEEILVNVTLTDAQSNTYNVELSGFTSGVTKETVAAKLKEAYPYITLGSTDQNGDVIDFGVLEANGTAYTYTNKVELPFKVSNAAYLWHNIYYPSNNSVGSKPGCPNYIAALNEDEVVDMAASGGYYYGDNPTYNTKDGGNSICWAIYNVNNSFEFIFKSRVTGKYIKVESVVNATGNTQNVKFVENAEDATAFTLLKDTGSYNGDYALVAKVGNATGYLCATSSSTNYVTHFDSKNHQGAWVKFVEAPDYFSMIQDLGIALGYFFGYGDRKCIITGTEIEPIDAALKDNEGGSITLNTLKAYALTIEEAMATWPTIRLSVAPDESGTVTINGEEGVTSKRAPDGHEFPIAAVPAEGYHFVNWTKGDDVLSSNAEHAVTISGVKGEITDITANFAINIYNINVTAGEGGSASASAATVEHGSEVTLTATPSSDYSFAGWYDGENLISAEANYTFTVTSHINYTARFNEAPTGTVAIHITVTSTDYTTVTNAVGGNVKAIINNIGQEWATGADFVVGADVELVATNDYDQKAYLFDGWYKNSVLVSNDLEITVQATEAATYEARFFRGCVVIGNSNNNRFGYVSSITLADGTSIGYDASNRAVVKAGTTVKINTFINMYGYEVGSWTNANDEIVSTDKDFIVEVNEDVTYTANFEPASYNLTVRANDESYGTVTAESGTSTGTTVKVGHNMEATITATANTGYYFVNWTKGTDVVSESATYTIAGIADIENMADAEYIANFLPVENATAGVYYRIGYDGFAAAASAGAARAATRAVGDTQTYVVSPTTGTPNEAGTFNSSWTYTKNGAYQADLTMVSTSNGNTVDKINTMMNGTQHSLCAYYKTDGIVYGIIYTVSVPENGNYKITGYSIGYTAYQNVTVNSTATNNGKTGSIQASGLDVYSFDFTVASTSSSGAIDISNFEVYIQQVDGGAGTPETPEPENPANRYYIQSEASGVTNKANALLMTQETGASSIFYYADSKLLSYDKGTYVKEDGTTRGLQAVGTSGTVTITTSGETTTIAAPSYLHAVDGTTRYVDHCSSNTGTAAHANHNFVLEEVESLPVTISSALHATFYAPVAVKIPDGIRAYVLKEKNITADSWVTMTMLQNGIIPANTGVILRSDEAKTYYFDITENIDEARAEAVGNILEGTVAKSYVNKDAYILTKKSNGVGMYPLSNNSYITGGATATFTNNSHKAYLPVEGNFAQLLQQGTGFRFVFDDGNTTGVEDIEREVEDTIYDLQGRKLTEITEPGIYIVGGKKVWVK